MPSAEQEDILSLLSAELAELTECDTRVFFGGAREQQIELLREFERTCEQLGGALNLAGLTGLAAACRLLEENFEAMAARSSSVAEAEAALLQTWAEQLDTYLNDFIDNCDQATTQLLDFLAAPAWPMPLSEKARETLVAQLADAELNGLEEESTLPSAADAEMVSLEIPTDVRPELLDGLLIELPEQVRGFEQSVNAYLSSREMSDLDTAQRMAHTLKGAANVVGVAGVANLMHYCEDLLEAAGATSAPLPGDFRQILQAVSDCLATMAESLCGQGAPPDNAVSVLDALLGSIRALKKQPTAGDADAEIEFDLSELEQLEQLGQAEQWSEQGENTEPPAAAKTEEPAKHFLASDGEERHFLTVPEATAQQLLRIAGEEQIGNTRLSAQIAAIQTSIQLADRYHKQIKAMAAELEALVQTRTGLTGATGNQGNGDIDPLELEHYSELHSFSHQLLELTTDSYEAVSQIGGQIDELATTAYTQKQLNRDNQELLLELRLVPVDTFASRFERCVRQAVRLTGKDAQLQIEGGELLMDSKVLNRIADPIMHLLRNAVDHGLEDDPAIRSRQGKSTQGRISLSFEHSGESIMIRCRDDGRGLNYGAIRDKALATGLADVDETLSKALLNQLIFLPSFTTRDKVSQTSGRGIGLDAVQTEIRALRGQLTVDSVPGEGSCFEIQVPASILTTHALVVRNDGDRGSSVLSVVTHSIEQVIYVEQERLLTEGEATYYQYDEERLPVFSLNDFTGIHTSADEQTSALLIVRKTDGSRVAVGVSAISASQDLVIKPLGRFCHHPEGVIGATIIGDGTVSPVLDLQKIPGMQLSRDELANLRAQRKRMASAQHSQSIAPVVFIVDDSLSVRRSLAQFITDMGMQVYTARDGFEAINLLDQHRPTLMLVDLEMPRMNGLELTTHLRANDATRHIPVIMVTSRSTEKHRNMARSAGVNGYLNKPWSDEDLLSTIQQQIA